MSVPRDGRVQLGDRRDGQLPSGGGRREYVADSPAEVTDAGSGLDERGGVFGWPTVGIPACYEGGG